MDDGGIWRTSRGGKVYHTSRAMAARKGPSATVSPPICMLLMFRPAALDGVVDGAEPGGPRPPEADGAAPLDVGRETVLLGVPVVKVPLPLPEPRSVSLVVLTALKLAQAMRVLFA